jgi:hypothetical protein
MPLLAIVLAGFAGPVGACEFHNMGFGGIGGMSGFGHMMPDGMVDAAVAPLPPPTREEALAAVRAQLLARTPALLAAAPDAAIAPNAAAPLSAGSQ